MDTLDLILKKYAPDTSVSPVALPIDRDGLAALFAELKFTKGAEIGVLWGRYSKTLCEKNPDLTLWSIDPWQVHPEYKKSLDDYEEVYQKAKKTLAPYDCVIIRSKSMDALRYFDDESLDFVYVDGNHEFTSEANDIHEWGKKVRKGGVISGHDYRHYRTASVSHSYQVVHAYTDSYSIHPWFITTANKSDPVRSWFWVKV